MIPKISVLIPAYNEEKTIERAIESVLNQTLKPYEIIVVNDGSTDRTGEILKKYEDNPSIIIINLTKNTGRKARAQRVALDYISGDIVAVMDADSELDPNFLLTLAPYFVYEDVGGATGMVMSKKRNWLTSVRQIQYIIAHMLYKLGMSVINAVLVMPGCGSLVRRELFEPEDDTLAEDMDLTLSILERGYRVIFDPRAITYTEDPPTIKLYVKQIKRWYSGALQSYRKRWSRLPLRVKMTVILITAESTIYPIALALAIASLILAHSSFIYLASILALDFIAYSIAAIAGAIKLRRIDLIPMIIPATFVRILDYLVWWECLIRECILRKRLTVWLRGK